MNPIKGTQPSEIGTEQVNLRISRVLLSDIKRISAVLGVHKTDWIRSQLATGVLTAKMKLVEDASKLRAAGVLTQEDFEKVVSGIKRELLGGIP